MLIGILVSSILCVAATVDSYNFIKVYLKLQKKGKETEGQIISKSDSYGAFKSNVTICYYLNAEIIKTRPVLSLFNFSVIIVGKKVTIFYDPDDPERIVIKNKTQITVILLALIVLYSGLAFLINANF